MAVWDHHFQRLKTPVFIPLFLAPSPTVRGQTPTNTVQNVIWIFAPPVACQNAPCLLGKIRERSVALGDGQTKSWYSTLVFGSLYTSLYAKTSCVSSWFFLCLYKFSFVLRKTKPRKKSEPSWVTFVGSKLDPSDGSREGDS